MVINQSQVISLAFSSKLKNVFSIIVLILCTNHVFAFKARSLEYYERQGGHTIRRHVGKSKSELKQRLLKSNRISAASTFFNKEIAHAVIRESLRRYHNRIQKWRSLQKKKLILRYRSLRVLGQGFFRNDMKFHNLKSAIIVLKRKGRKRFYVLTAYPTK